MAREKKSPKTSRGRTTGGRAPTKGLQVTAVRKSVKIAQLDALQKQKLAKQDAEKQPPVVNLVDNDTEVGNSGEASTSGPQIHKGKATCSICGIDVKRYYEAQYCKHPVCKDCFSPNSMLLLCQDNYCSVVAKDLKDWKKEFDASQAAEVIDVDCEPVAKKSKISKSDAAGPDDDTDGGLISSGEESDLNSGTPIRGRGMGRGSRGGRGGFSKVSRGRGSSQPATRGGSVERPASPQRPASVPRKRSDAQKKEGPVSFKCGSCEKTKFVMNVMHCGRQICNECLKKFGSNVLNPCYECPVCFDRGILPDEIVEENFKAKRTESYALKDAIAKNRAKTVYLCADCHKKCDDASKLGCVHFLCRECWSGRQLMQPMLPDFGQPTTVKCQGTCPEEEQMKHRESMGPVIKLGDNIDALLQKYSERDIVNATREDGKHTEMFTRSTSNSTYGIVFQSPGSGMLGQKGQQGHFLYDFFERKIIKEASTALKLLCETDQAFYSLEKGFLERNECAAISGAWMFRPLDFPNATTDKSNGLTFGCVYTILFESSFKPKQNKNNEGIIVMLAPDFDLSPEIFAQRCLQMGAALSLNNMFFLLKHGGRPNDVELHQCVASYRENYESWKGDESLIKLLKQHSQVNLKYLPTISHFFVTLPMESFYRDKLKVFCSQFYEGLSFERRFCNLTYHFDGYNGLYSEAVNRDHVALPEIGEGSDSASKPREDEKGNLDHEGNDYDHTLDFPDDHYSSHSDGVRDGPVIPEACNQQPDMTSDHVTGIESEEFKITMDMLCSEESIAVSEERSRLSLESKIMRLKNAKIPEIDMSSELGQDMPEYLYLSHVELRSKNRQLDAKISRFCARFDQTVALGGNVKSSDVEKPSGEWFRGEEGHQDEDDPLLLRTVPIDPPTLNLLDHPEVKKWLSENPNRVKFINHCGMTNPIEAPDEKYGELYMKFCTSVLPLITENGKLKSLLELVKKPIEGISDIMSGEDLHELLIEWTSVVKSNESLNYPLTLLITRGSFSGDEVKWFTHKCFYPDQFCHADVVLYVLRTIGMLFMDRFGLPKFYSTLLCFKKNDEYFALTEYVAVNCKGYDFGFVPNREYIDLHLKRFPKTHTFYTIINYENLHFFLLCVVLYDDPKPVIEVILTDSSVECVPRSKRKEYLASIEIQLRKEFEGSEYKCFIKYFEQCHCNCGFFCILRILDLSFKTVSLNPVEELHNKHFRETLSCVLCAQLMCLVPVYGIDEYPLPDEVASKIPEISFPFVRRPV